MQLHSTLGVAGKRLFISVVSRVVESGGWSSLGLVAEDPTRQCSGALRVRLGTGLLGFATVVLPPEKIVAKRNAGETFRDSRIGVPGQAVPGAL